MAKMIVSKALKEKNILTEDKMNEIKFSKKYQIVSENTSLFAEIKNNNKITENSIEIKNDYSGSSDKENIIMEQMSQMINNKMNNHIGMYKQWRNNYDIDKS
jgi:hypothetical protein